MSDTPQTDAHEKLVKGPNPFSPYEHPVVDSEFARTLERENTTLHAAKPGTHSDGYHTFDELYQHRCTLFLALMRSNPGLSWFSSAHHDETVWEGWFIAGMTLPTGDVTYHLPTTMWDLAVKTGATLLRTGREWDGHTAADVVKRIQAWIA